MNLNYPQRNFVLLFLCILCLQFGFSQISNSDKAQKYLDLKGEITFNIQVNDTGDIQKFAEGLSIVNYDPDTKKLKLWGNEVQFEAFLQKGIAFEVEDIDNDSSVAAPDLTKPGDPTKATSVPCSSITPLTFPLTDYPTYDEYECTMIAFAAAYPGICELVDIGGTTEGVGGGDKRLLFIKLSDNVSTREQEPRLMYTSSMHGDEIAGYPMMLDLIN